MRHVTDCFLTGLEYEFAMTVWNHDGSPLRNDRGASLLFTHLEKCVPCLPGPRGIFTPYGRVYVEFTGHLEVASIEVDRPELLHVVMEQQFALIKEAARRLQEDDGVSIILTNNNFSGTFSLGSTSVYGAHENFLVERRPHTLGSRMLPFLASRALFAGHGVVDRSGRYLAGVRAHAMLRDTGGDTQHDRALFSTFRDEPHMGPSAGHRLHLICSDSHRSAWNMTLQAGATLLAIKAVIHNPSLLRRLPAFCKTDVSSWNEFMREVNVLAKPGKLPRVDPRVVAIQRVYWDGARELLESWESPPAWVEGCLANWKATLDAMQIGDYDFLSTRLDAWIKHRLFSVLAAKGCDWRELAQRPETTLLDQNYHALIADKESVFDLAERQDLLQHRVAAIPAPGTELEPYVPDTNTRARARARFIRAHAGDHTFLMDWGSVTNRTTRKKQWSLEPFGEYGPECESDENLFAEEIYHLQETGDVCGPSLPSCYEAGRFELAFECLCALEPQPNVQHNEWMRPNSFTIWVQVRRGLGDAQLANILHRMYPPPHDSLGNIIEHLFFHRFRGVFLPDEIDVWVNRGLEIIERDGSENLSGLAGTFYEHAGYVWLHRGQIAGAIQVLEKLTRDHWSDRISVRALTTLADCYRTSGEFDRAKDCLRKADAVCQGQGYGAEQADFVWTGLAKLEPQNAMELLQRAKAFQAENGSRVGLARTLLLQARIGSTPEGLDQVRTNLNGLCVQCPTLLCERLVRVLEEGNWRHWINRCEEEGLRGTYGGL